MKILQACALVSVCVIAAAALALVAMGYSIRLEAPESHAAPIVDGVVSIFDRDSQEPYLLMADGSVYLVFEGSEGTSFVQESGPGYDLPAGVSPSDVLWWQRTRFITSDGIYWVYYGSSWTPTPIPSLPIGASTGAMSGIKGRY